MATERLTVLVVDDEPSIRHYLMRRLEIWGYAVRQAGSATEALEAMMVAAASIVICDILMPGHDGVWLLKRLHSQWPATAVIMATCVDQLPTVMQCRLEGAVDYVLKPFDREMLLQALQRAEALPGT